jgi:hypothetical protein
MGFAMPASAKPKPKNSGGFSVGCLLNDSTLQGEEGLSSSDPPAVVTISPARLWPPNHKLKNMLISMSPAANSSSVVDVSLTITNITDDQISDDDAGDAGCGPATSLQGADWSPTDFSSLTASGSVQNTTDAVSIPGVQLRGERCAMDGTRTYAVSVTCCDITNGNVCDSTPGVLDVTVPKSRKPAVTSAHQS